MVVVSVVLAMWIGVVWWQDKRTQQMQLELTNVELKLEDCAVMEHQDRTTDAKSQPQT